MANNNNNNTTKQLSLPKSHLHIPAAIHKLMISHNIYLYTYTRRNEAYTEKSTFKLSRYRIEQAWRYPFPLYGSSIWNIIRISMQTNDKQYSLSQHLLINGLIYFKCRFLTLRGFALLDCSVKWKVPCICFWL